MGGEISPGELVGWVAYGGLGSGPVWPDDAYLSIELLGEVDRIPSSTATLPLSLKRSRQEQVGGIDDITITSEVRLRLKGQVIYAAQFPMIVTIRTGMRNNAAGRVKLSDDASSLHVSALAGAVVKLLDGLGGHGKLEHTLLEDTHAKTSASESELHNG